MVLVLNACSNHLKQNKNTNVQADCRDPGPGLGHQQMFIFNFSEWFECPAKVEKHWSSPNKRLPICPTPSILPKRIIPQAREDFFLVMQLSGCKMEAKVQVSLFPPLTMDGHWRLPRNIKKILMPGIHFHWFWGTCSWVWTRHADFKALQLILICGPSREPSPHSKFNVNIL